jgi:oxidase EvaA
MSFNLILKNYKEFLKKENILNIDNLRLEAIVESLQDWSELMTLEQTKDWFLEKKNNCQMDVSISPLGELKDWEFRNKTDLIEHKNKSFFSIIGIKVSNSTTREIKSGWDQPILKEKNNDGGIVGIIRKKSNDIPYYLVEAKAEPGNPDLVQISPSLQATYSNLEQSHGGRQPHFAELFLDPKKYNCKILFDQLMSEDGGRLYKKRNKGMIIEISENYSLTIKDNFCWLSLYQLKSLIKINSWVNPHVRSLISHL